MLSDALTTRPPPYRPTLLGMKLAAASTASDWPESFPLFAHQGGWDEILIVALPLLLIGSLLYIANKRVDAKLAERSADDSHTRT